MDTPAKQALTRIETALGEGKTVYVQTHLRTTVINSKSLENFNKIGRPLFKAGKSLYMSSGNKYVCIDHCRITAQ